MNQLPEHRRAINGRTFSRQWRPEEWAAVETYRQPCWERIADVVMAVAIGIVLAIILVSWAAQ
jgi:hypothetical protein